MTTPQLPAAIEAEEGRKAAAYPDPLTHAEPFTIGVGHTGPEVRLGLVWTNEQIDRALQSDIAKAEAGLDAHLPWWRKLSDVRQDAVLQLAFQMGVNGLVAFHRSLTALEDGLYDQAADDFLQSLWAKQTPARAKRITDLIRTGAYPS